MIRPEWLLAAVLAGALVSGCGDSGDETFAFSSSSDEAEHYLEVWCSVEPGMTRDAAIDIMGEPTSEFDASSGFQPQSQWDAGDFDYTAFYGSDGRVELLQINSLSIDPESREELDCPLVRR